MAKVVFTEPAEYDLLDIEYYIFVDLCNPQAARRITDGILGIVDKLAEYPEGHPLVGEELLGRMGIRIAYFDNYNIFYYYDMQNGIVYIIRILYNKADWQSILKR
ncbi:MAG: type II toxin-antitoxin system RelE/ParE family toxin [Bacillus sp. (in: Bacteria)]|nr:type II toxin-antitoxin system RelE/ParE family toxin [Bacillus sp. (in: firmicutes)]MCM1427899.1 type II toxin-antitoxin system RelE/ParE family toxin [Eubacterium sp.]